MPAQIINGEAIAAQVTSELKSEVETLKSKGVQPKLVAVLATKNKGARIYANNQAKTCTEIGIEYELLELSPASKEEEIPTFSLEDLLVRRPTPFSGRTESKEKKPKKKKEVEKEELRKALRESLEEMDKDEEPKNTKRGKIEPGETIKF